MNAKFETSFCIEAPTVNGYPSVATICVIEGNNSLVDIVAHIFVEPDGKLVISTNRPEAINIRQEEVRNSLPEGDYFLGQSTTEFSKKWKKNCNVYFTHPNVSGHFSNDNGSVMYPHAPLDKHHRNC